jgi:hypothetical protein
MADIRYTNALPDDMARTRQQWTVKDEVGREPPKLWAWAAHDEKRALEKQQQQQREEVLPAPKPARRIIIRKPKR